MAASVLQEKAWTLAAGSATSFTSTAFASNATVGSTIEVWITCANGGTAPSSVVDSASQSYSEQTTAVDSGSGQAFWVYAFANNASATALTVTATWAAATTERGVWTKEIGGVSTTPIQTSLMAAQTTPGTATNAITTGNLTPTAQPFLISSVVLIVGTANTVAIGTGFTSGSTATGTFYSGLSESKRLTTLTALAATYTDATNGGTFNYVTGAVIYSESATYSGVSSLDYSIVTGANTINTTGAGGPTNTLAVTLGKLLIGIGYSQNIPSCTFSDSLGNVWSAFNPSYAATNGTIGLGLFWTLVTHAGTANFTLAGSGTCNCIWVTQYTVSTNGRLVNAAGNYYPSIGSGTNNATTGVIAGNAAPALWMGFCFDPAATITPGNGSGFTANGAIWETFQGGTVAPARPENALLSGNNAVTFSTNNPGDKVYILGATFSLSTYVPPLVGGPIPRLIYIMP